MIRCRLAICLLCGLWVGASAAADDAAVALVNGEAITASQLAKGIPAGAFGQTLVSARTARLGQLIEIVSLRQRLKAIGADAEETAVDRAFATVVAAKPPPMACGCCSYHDYDDYLVQNFLTREDARLRVWIDLALDRHLAAAWDSAHAGEADKAAVLAAEGPTLRQGRIRLYRVSFPYAEGERPGVRGQAWQLAIQARDRINAGETIPKVVADMVVNPAQALLDGEISPRHFASNQPPPDLWPAGRVSTPLAEQTGYTVMLWQPLTDSDILAVVKRAAVVLDHSAFITSVRRERQVEYRGSDTAVAPATDR